MKLLEIDERVLRSKPRLTRGAKLAAAKGQLKIPHYPAIPLNSTAVWIVSRLNESKAVLEILAEAKEIYPDVNDEVLHRDIVDFIYNLYEWGYVENVDLPKPSSYVAPLVFKQEALDAGRSGCGMCKETFL